MNRCSVYLLSQIKADKEWISIHECAMLSGFYVLCLHYRLNNPDAGAIFHFEVPRDQLCYFMAPYFLFPWRWHWNITANMQPDSFDIWKYLGLQSH